MCTALGVISLRSSFFGTLALSHGNTARAHIYDIERLSRGLFQ